MKMPFSASDGFTLLEVVIVLLLVSVASSMLVPYMRAGLDQSAQAPLRLVQSGAISARMAQIMTRGTNNLETLRVQLVAEGINAAYITFPETPPYVAVSGGTDLLRVEVTDAQNHRLVTILGRPQ
jgi:prepilin-type N-terminal cleavage/methylation domain-containing protein